jgi:protein-L-isoaspartate(D-aspartate) O-methyltransferase
MSDFSVARTMMVDGQVRTADVTDHRLLQAMLEVPREKFVAAEQASLAYLDRDLPIAAGRYLMPPATLAKLLQLAEIQPGDKVLVVGAGTGYAAVITAKLAANVVALESDAALAAVARRECAGAGNVSLVIGALEAGHAAGAPYDVILVEGAIEFLPDALAGQLAENGRLVAVVGAGLSGQATIVIRENGRLSWRSAFNAALRPLPGFQKRHEFVF